MQNKLQSAWQQKSHYTLQEEGLNIPPFWWTLTSLLKCPCLKYKNYILHIQLNENSPEKTCISKVCAYIKFKQFTRFSSSIYMNYKCLFAGPVDSVNGTAWLETCMAQIYKCVPASWLRWIKTIHKNHRPSSGETCGIHAT